MTDAFFIIAAFLTFYTYAGYGLILLALPTRPSTTPTYDGPLPEVTVLIPARNEADVIGAIASSLLSVEYPRDLLRAIIISDASTDDTDAIVQAIGDNRVELVRLDERVGKYRALQEALPYCTSEILILADASSIFDKRSILALVNRFSDPGVGAVTGAKCILGTNSSVASGDGLYWRYEAWMRTMETRAGASWVGVEGGFFGIRRTLLSLNFPQYIAADYAICCAVYERGFLHVYEPRAKISEPPTSGMQQEFVRKIRVIVRGIKALFYFRYLLNPFKHPFFSFQNISHRLMRWLVPFFLIMLLVTSGCSQSAWIHTTLYAQLGFYLTAVTGGILRLSGNWSRILNVPWYFAVVNLSALVSWFVLYRNYDKWQPPKRSQLQ